MTLNRRLVNNQWYWVPEGVEWNSTTQRFTTAEGHEVVCQPAQPPEDNHDYAATIEQYVHTPEPAPVSSAPATVGRKNDQGKARFDLLDPEALTGLVNVLTFGASKYDDRNWEKGIKYGRVFGAAMRHLWTWWKGEDNDPETGLSHLDHAACCIHFLSTYTKRSMTEFDDRPRRDPR